MNTLKFLTALIFTSVLTSCADEPMTYGPTRYGEPKPKQPTLQWKEIPGGNGRQIGIYTDPETNCQYLIHHGITPRLYPSGHPMC
jgi:hypothetical protein